MSVAQRLLRLLRLLMIDGLHAVRVPSTQEEALRNLVRARENIPRRPDARVPPYEQGSVTAAMPLERERPVLGELGQAEGEVVQRRRERGFVGGRVGSRKRRRTVTASFDRGEALVESPRVRQAEGEVLARWGSRCCEGCGVQTLPRGPDLRARGVRFGVL